MSVADIAAFAVFAALWVFFTPLRRLVSRKRSGLNENLAPMRRAWMREMLARDNRIGDAALLGHVINSASFFASTNLLLIAAAAGLLVGGQSSMASLPDLTVIADAPLWLIEAKVALVIVVLARGLLAFVWAIRQINYCVTLLGAAPRHDAPERHADYGAAFAAVLDPAMDAFNRGVRGYYFALAAAAWLAAGWAMALAALGAFALLAWRQTDSPAAGGVRAARDLIQAAHSANDD